MLHVFFRLLPPFTFPDVSSEQTSVTLIVLLVFILLLG